MSWKFTNEQLFSCLLEFKRTGAELAILNMVMNKRIDGVPQYQIHIRNHNGEMVNIPDNFEDEFYITILLESMVIRLQRLYEIHPTLGNVIVDTMKGCPNILKGLKNLWLQIEDAKDKVESWRNDFLVHSDRRALNFKPHFIIDTEYLETFRKITLASRLAALYYTTIEKFIPYLFKAADIWKEIEYGREDLWYVKEWWNQLKVKEKELIDATNNDLKIHRSSVRIDYPKFENFA